ncbi:MAG: TonB-dependent receptor, partial [Rhodothermales bacterium]|nr:TonB-dependent receptor [Rhodothermales bacterium]
GILAFNNDYDNTTWSGSLYAKPDERTDVTLSVRYADTEFHVPTDGSGNLVDRNAFNLHEQLSGTLDVGRYLSDRVELRVQLSLNEFDGGFDDQPDSPGDTLGFFGFRSVQNQTRRGVDARMNVHADGAVLTGGVHVEEQKERSFDESISEFGNSTSSLDVQRLNVAAYGQMHAMLIRGLALTAGVRIDDNEEFGTFFTFRGGLSYVLTTGTRLRGSVGRAFKEPTFFENFSANVFARGNPDLKPERSLTWELAVEQELWESRLHLGATFFEQRFRDLIQYTFAPPNPTDPNFFNLPAATARGVEVEAAIRPARTLMIRTAVTGLDTEVDNPGFDTTAGDEFVRDSTLLRRPAFTLTAEVSYRLLDRATLSPVVQHVGARADRDFSTFPATRIALDPYTDLAISADIDLYRTGSGTTVALQCRVDNVLDEAYQEVFGFSAPGRRIAAGVRAQF